jgi:hypothetical protein
VREVPQTEMTPLYPRSQVREGDDGALDHRAIPAADQAREHSFGAAHLEPGNEVDHTNRSPSHSRLKGVRESSLARACRSEFREGDSIRKGTAFGTTLVDARAVEREL